MEEKRPARYWLRPLRSLALLATLVTVALLLACLLPVFAPVSRAANPPPVQYYFVSLPEDDLLRLFDDDDTAGGTFPDPISPIRSGTSISIVAANTWIYYDQWEDGGYDANIANPGANLYDASTNPDGTQIWGDGDVSNGCPPSINGLINPCAQASHDQLLAGQAIILDNDVAIAGASPGPYSRNAAQIYFDGRDKIGASSPVAVTRAAFPLSPGSVMAGGAEVLDTTRWGLYYVSPLGENTPGGSTSAFEDVRWFIMAGVGGATIDVDANGDGDLLDANDLNDSVMVQGAKRYVDGIQEGATLAVVAGNPVQVNLMTADVGDTFEFRWDALIPRDSWTNDYYSPVGTQPDTTEGNRGCTEVWVYNPNDAQITVNIDREGGVNPDATLTVDPEDANEWPAAATNLYNDGFRLYTTGSPAPVFLPIQIVDCTKDTSDTDGRLFDWGNPLFPADQLTSEVLVGWAPGCTNESPDGICYDPDRDVTTSGSRSVVWVTPLAATTIYVDTNGSGITCPGGAGAEKTIASNALVSNRITDDPTTRAYVHDFFSTQSYSRDDSVTGWPAGQIWSGDWTETGDDASATSGAIYIDATADALRLRDNGIAEAGLTVHRRHNTSGSSFARFSFRLSGSGLDAGDDRMAAEVSGDNGATWFTLRVFNGPVTGTTTEVFNISPFVGTNMLVRFRFVDSLEAGEYWQVDYVHIDYASGGDFDMTGSRIRTCDGTLIAAAYGQNPNLSGGNDDEALDLGTGIAPFQYLELALGAIGNYVWLDEDGDGVQDAGEAGIPNVKLTLTGTATDGTAYSLITYTDAQGGYLFADLKPANAGGYTITVDPATLPAGLAANPTYDENGTGTPHTTNDVLSAGEEHMTADFGYNWAPTSDVQGNTGLGAIGDRVWIDSDGDGVQDPEEVGLYNQTVQLYYDADGNGLYDDLYTVGGYTPTTSTDHNGNYIFDGLPAGAYVVRVTPPINYNQTGDPDATLDHQTTNPVVLAPGDVYLNADFGYQPTGDSGSIGDTVWVDADRNNAQNGAEPGIPGVTVSLIKDLNGSGAWEAGEPIIATDITDEDGLYLFAGLPIPADGNDYLVWVNDTNHVLGELDPVYDVRDGGSQGNPTTGLVTGLEISAVTDLTAAPVTNADFAYAPPGHDSGDGLIGDTIFLDRNDSGGFDPGEGLEGVVVELFDDTGRLVATTTTNENGQYFFGDLPADTYSVEVDPSTLPGAGVGLTNTIDPDGGLANQSTVVLGAGGINLDQDFGYRPFADQPLNSISGTIWEDTNADGTLLGEAGRFEGVTVVLYEDTNGNGILDGGDNVVGTTSTDSNGDYSFTGLPNGTYLVDVTDDLNLLNGYWKSDGPTLGDDNNSQPDPYLVAVSGGQTDVTADFGYYIDPAALGDWVWHDLNADGVQDAGELGIPGVPVTLLITYPNAATTTIVTTTDANGYYSFENLLLDENFDGVGAPEPVFVISVASPAGYASSPQDTTTEDLDSDNPAGQTATTTKGSTNETYDFGYENNTTAVTVVSFSGQWTAGGVLLNWKTATEINNSGFHLKRSESLEGSQVPITAKLIRSESDGGPAEYDHLDTSAVPGTVYYYWLYSESSDGRLSAPKWTVVGRTHYLYLPLVGRAY